MSGWLFPDPQRRIPGRRTLNIALRTAHLATFGALLGGHLFDVDPARLLPFLWATVASGVALTAMEIAATGEWLFMLQGIAVLAKLVLLLLVPLFWDQRVVLLLLVVVIASVGSHMPARLRHYSLLRGRVLTPPPRRESDLAGSR